MKYRKHQVISAVLFNFALFGLIYYWLQKSVHFDVLLTDIEQTNLFSIFLLIVLYSLVLAIYAWRLSFLLKSNFRKSLGITIIGNGLNNLLPFRLGDFLRVYFSKRFYDIDTSRSAAATFMERYIDLVILILIGLVVLNQQQKIEHHAFYLFFVLLAGCALGIVLYRYLIMRDNYIKRWLYRFFWIRSLLEAFHEIVVARNKGLIFAATFLLWLVTFISYYVFFSLNVAPVSFGVNAAIFLMFATTLSFAVPYTIAGIGIFEASIVYYLIKYLHMAAAKALAVALVFHFSMAFPQVILVMLIFLRQRNRRSEVVEA